MNQLSCDTVIIGAGVVGLAIAAHLPEGRETIVLERHASFGNEASSRNSEVVHSGIYYPIDSLKTQLCIEGRKRLYEYCQAHAIPFARTGKLVVATKPEDRAYLESLQQHAESLGVRCVGHSAEKVSELEPMVQCLDALFFPESGLIDSHAFLAKLEAQAAGQKVTLAYQHEVQRIENTGDGWDLTVCSSAGVFSLHCRRLVNAAGLHAALLSNQALGNCRYQHVPCRGRYFHLPSRYRNRFRHLVYPVPPQDGLGIHVTIDFAKEPRLGPDVHWGPKDPAQWQSLTQCDWDSLRADFAAAASRYLPAIRPEDLRPGFIGVRSKLFVDGVAHRDFLIERQGSFIHCLGIESPGLTASLAIAERVRQWWLEE